MSSIKLESNASGTGIFTIVSPNSNTNRTLTLPDATGTIITTAGGAAISGTTGTFTGLVDISAAGAGQIQFPATQNASSNANTLDDYEEGTWTPVIAFGGGSTGQSYSAQTGHYTKVGRMVTCSLRVTFSNKGSSTGAATVTGLPFTAGGTYNVVVYAQDNLTGLTSPSAVIGVVENGATSVSIRQTAGNSNTGLDNTTFQNNSSLFSTITYQV